MTDTFSQSLRIFLCHSSGDKPAVRELYHRLRADGFTPWLDEEDLLPGQDWQREIPKAVRAADVVIVCLSRGSVTKAGYVQKEIKFALDVADEQPENAIFLIPLRLEQCEVPDRLSHLQWVNLYDEGGYAHLLRPLRRRADGLDLSRPAVVSAGTSTEQPPAKRVSASEVTEDDRASLQKQLNELRRNLTLIEERKAEYVLGVEVPLQLIKEERRLRERIAELEVKLGASGQPPPARVSTETPPPASRPPLDLAAGIVAICAANGDIEGTGFVVADRLILTCAHVVEAASSGPGGSIGVRFHLNGARQTAEVVSEYWRGPDADDIAVLRLVENLPAGVQPLGLGKSIGCEKHAFRSLGYPTVGDYVGIAASGVIESSTQKADGRRMLQLTSTQLAQGHSGAPVWDESQQGVAGMVSEVYHAGKDNKNRDTAFATPAETILEVCAELTQK